MEQERRTANTGVKGSHFTGGQRMVLEWAGYTCRWNGKGGRRKERSPGKPAATLGKNRRAKAR